MKDVLFIVNPKAASGRASRVWSSLCDGLPSLRKAPLLHWSGADSVRQAIVAALTPRIRRVVVLGGDGTLHALVNVMLNEASDTSRCLGLVPVGTGSDLARGLGLDQKPVHALTRALDAPPGCLDVLRLQSGQQSRYFLNEASLGITAMVAARVNALSHRNAGTFLGAALRELVTYKPKWARIHLDGKLWREGFFYMVVVANCTHFGRGMRIAPTADAADGYADIVVVENASRALLLAWLPSIYLGKHLKAPFVHCARAQTIDIDTGPECLVFEGDGEVTLPAPGNITVLPDAVLFCGAGRQTVT
ncbi:diacylglycerol/lipid kinase family protein [Actimicrobium antarcticum]|uniref:Diacylglycerol kinase family lipid kinase n=1 Tax=Actimicrobium antarcticum TaxID=1051899 RepID=A0ABP7TPP8_9BURK